MKESYDVWTLYFMQGKVMITEEGEGWFCYTDRTLFYGKIKNKSELKKVLNQIGIIK